MYNLSLLSLSSSSSSSSSVSKVKSRHKFPAFEGEIILQKRLAILSDYLHGLMAVHNKTQVRANSLIIQLSQEFVPFSYYYKKKFSKNFRKPLSLQQRTRRKCIKKYIFYNAYHLFEEEIHSVSTLMTCTPVLLHGSELECHICVHFSTHVSNDDFY